jgi:hypothetical protein
MHLQRQATTSAHLPPEHASYSSISSPSLPSLFDYLLGNLGDPRRLYHLGKSAKFSSALLCEFFSEKSLPGKSWFLAKVFFLAKIKKFLGNMFDG